MVDTSLHVERKMTEADLGVELAVSAETIEWIARNVSNFVIEFLGQPQQDGAMGNEHPFFGTDAIRIHFEEMDIQNAVGISDNIERLCRSITLHIVNVGNGFPDIAAQEINAAHGRAEELSRLGVPDAHLLHIWNIAWSAANNTFQYHRLQSSEGSPGNPTALADVFLSLIEIHKVVLASGALACCSETIRTMASDAARYVANTRDGILDVEGEHEVQRQAREVAEHLQVGLAGDTIGDRMKMIFLDTTHSVWNLLTGQNIDSDAAENGRRISDCALQLQRIGVPGDVVRRILSLAWDAACHEVTRRYPSGNGEDAYGALTLWDQRLTDHVRSLAACSASVQPQAEDPWWQYVKVEHMRVEHVALLFGKLMSDRDTMHVVLKEQIDGMDLVSVMNDDEYNAKMQTVPLARESRRALERWLRYKSASELACGRNLETLLPNEFAHLLEFNVCLRAELARRVVDRGICGKVLADFDADEGMMHVPLNLEEKLKVQDWLTLRKRKLSCKYVPFRSMSSEQLAHLLCAELGLSTIYMHKVLDLRLQGSSLIELDSIRRTLGMPTEEFEILEAWVTSRCSSIALDGYIRNALEDKRPDNVRSARDTLYDLRDSIQQWDAWLEYRADPARAVRVQWILDRFPGL
ncbi:hypothetical protein FVE85_9554 [Porphyridium purpureum]|uniref:Uncharacterized protein n=1 Tax=Porphyridium purpureum TaxID=35688 RepID=A0A5J4YHQ6_PORPP|nr:hypothetical protein FVE85_9888 [Porphyridium purpureum]KAA8491259.1 hypothetical protein FVE85_9554 [Porphyridium purpureum]|eukprot:POR7282..scf289_17